MAVAAERRHLPRDRFVFRGEGGARPRVTTESGFTLTAGAVVVATNTPVNERVLPSLKQYAHRTYVVGFRVPPGAVPRALYWDTDVPYHYVRLARGGDSSAELFISGGEDHRTGQADDVEERYARLEAWTRERFPVEGERVFAGRARWRSRPTGWPSSAPAWTAPGTSTSPPATPATA